MHRPASRQITSIFRTFRTALLIFMLALPCAFAGPLDVQVSATVQVSPPSITLQWPQDTSVSGYSISRKGKTDTSWNAIGSAGGSATSYTDNNVTVGTEYEYQVVKTGSSTGYGYVFAAITAPLIEDRGKVVLLVDNSFSSALSAELTRLQQDLAGDGWTVLRHDVSRTDTVPNIKKVITSDFNADTSNVKAVFLFGHVPVPYSGNLNPDGHAEHLGAWPADGYYGDMYGTWTDVSVNNSTATDPRNWNVPGDGKFDQSTLPHDLSLEVGRVDLSNMPSFSLSEQELLRQYLNKDHNYRCKLVTLQRRALVYDNFNLPEAFSASGYRLSGSVGPGNVTYGGWLSTLNTQPYQWAYGCGPGWWNYAEGVASTADFANTDIEVNFTMLFGSFFGDFDCQNNFLRAPLGAKTYALTCAWAGRPPWYFHHMALGETIGYSARLSQNNSGLYPIGAAGARGVHMALMGDPTLRLHPVAPPVNLAGTTGSGASLTWQASSDPVAGYHVYRAAGPSGPYTRLTSTLVTGTSYQDTSVSSGTYTYMVRAVNLEVGAGGSYYNPSEGVFLTLNLSGNTVSAPVINSALTGTATVGSAFSYTIAATNNPTGFNATGLPSGLSVNTATGVISGTPTVAGSSGVSLSATNSGGTGSAGLALTIKPAAPVITGALASSGTVGTSFSYTITAGNTPASFNATGLPPGLSVSTASGVISGTPTAAGASSVSLSATNAGGIGSATLTLTIAAVPATPVPPVPPAAPVIGGALASAGTVGTVFSYTITAGNSPASFNATGLPAGLSVNTATGVISGIPTAAGTSNVSLSATNAGGTGSATLLVTIGAASANAPAITSLQVTPAAAVVSQPVTATGAAVAANGGTVTLSWDFGDGTPPVTGATATHVYTAAGVFVVTLTAASGPQTTAQQTSITVSPDNSPPGGGATPPSGPSLALTNGKATLLLDMARPLNSSFSAQAGGVAFSGLTQAALAGKSVTLSVAGGLSYNFTLDKLGRGRSGALTGFQLNLREKTLHCRISKEAALNGLLSSLSGFNYVTPHVGMVKQPSYKLTIPVSVSLDGGEYTIGMTFEMQCEQCRTVVRGCSAPQ